MANVLFEKFAANRTLEVEGVTIDVGDGITFQVARRNKSNKRYAKALEAATKPYQTAIEKETLSSETSEQILLDVFCETILLGWKGVKYDAMLGDAGLMNPQPLEDGTLPFSPHNARLLMATLPELYDDLAKQSSRLANFREKQDKDDAKN